MRAFITGASSGIGRELSKRLAEQGYDLVLVARRIERLEAIKEQYKEREIIIKQVDLSDEGQLTQLMNDLKLFSFDLFINNAGFGKVDFSANIPTDIELNMIEVNIVALHRLTKFAVEHMSSGKIVNISSLASYLPTPLLASYAATKYYVRTYSEALNYELKKQKKPIKVLTVTPGPIETEFGETSGMKLKGMPVGKCVRAILKGIKKNKTVIVPGFAMRFLRGIIRFVPRRLLLKISYRIQNNK